MKRRKWLWITCAAVAAVVAVCWVALAYKPVPFEFLSGAKLSPTQPHVYVADPTGSVLLTAYRAEGPMDALIERAHRELAADPDWEWSTADFGELCYNATLRESLSFHVSREGMATNPPQVSVIHSRPATFLDRLRDWFDRRSR